MTVYILDIYNHKLPDGSKPCIMSADTEKELHDMAKELDVKPEMFSGKDSAPFYVISKSKMKIAKNKGVLIGKEARAMIEYKKKYPQYRG